MNNTIATRYRINRGITLTFLGVCTGVYGSWNYADKGAVYSGYESLRQSSSNSQGHSPLPEISPARVRRTLVEKFTLSTNKVDSTSLLASSCSHQHLFHFLANTLSIASLAPYVSIALPPLQFAGLLAGSAVAASSTWLYVESRRVSSSFGPPRQALGASGIAMGLLASAALYNPFARIVVFVVPMPMWVGASVLTAIDAAMMLSGGESPIGHSAHLGGAAFGLLYYVFVGRRYGGIMASMPRASRRR